MTVTRSRRNPLTALLTSAWWRDPVVLLVLLALSPIFLGDYQLLSLGSYLPYGIAAAALALVWGYCGILALGQACFFGIGAYACAKGLQQVGSVSGLVLGVAIGVIAAAFVAWLLARASFGLRADTFLISVTTFCTAVAFEQLALKFTSVTGGQNGIALDRILPKDPLPKYYIALAVFAGALTLLTIVSRSDVGRLIAATRDNATRARYFGTDTDRLKRRVFVLGAVVTSMAGAMDAIYSRIAAPDKIGFGFSTLILLWCALGGRRSLASAALGALLVNMVGNQLSGVLVNYWQVILALAFIVVVMFYPDGLYWPIRRLGRRIDAPEHMRITPVDPPMQREVDSPAFIGDNLKQQFGDFTALDIEHIDFEKGAVTALIGPNGAGKSTFISLASGGLRSAQGRAVMLDESILGRPDYLVARLDVKRKFQTPSVFESISVQENLFIGATESALGIQDWFRRSHDMGLPSDVLALARDHDLLSRSSLEAGELGHGSKQFLEVCMVLASSPRVVLLDEPTAGMSAGDRIRIGEVIQSIARRGVAVLVIEHDFDFVRQVADRILVLNQGRLIASGTVDQVSRNPQVRALYLGASE